MKEKTTDLNLLFVDDDPNEFVVMDLLCKKADDHKINLTCIHTIEEACQVLKDQDIDIILLDNQLLIESDFRKSVPQLRATEYTGPIGIVSSNVRTDYFKDIEKYGADFRIGKDELDRASVFHIINEFAPKALT